MPAGAEETGAGVSVGCGVVVAAAPGVSVEVTGAAESVTAAGGALVMTGAGVTVRLADVFLVTVTLQMYFLPPAFAVILAVPLFLAVTFPFAFTAATFFLEEVHLTGAFVPFSFNLQVFPTVRLTFFLFSLIFAARVR